MQIKTTTPYSIKNYSYWRNAFLWISLHNEKPNSVCVTDYDAPVQLFVNKDPATGCLDDEVCGCIIYDPQYDMQQKQAVIDKLGFGKDFDIASVVAGGYRFDSRCTLVT